jgi:hypothetical protein
MEGEINTIEDLAILMTQTMASKEDMKGLASKEDVQGVQAEVTGLREEMNQMEGRLTTRLDYLDARVGRIEADVHALRDEMVHRQEFQDILDRVKYIERKLGIESGV